MAGADVPQKAAAPKKSGGLRIRKPKRRSAVRIDMTPMVDVAFLLLIFFMVTTVFRKPLAMEINLPEAEASIKVPEENVMTIYVRADDSMMFKLGTGPLQPLTWNELYQNFRNGVERNPALIVLVKIHRAARYDSMVEMMDTLEDARMERFSVIAMKDEDMKLMQEAGR